VPNERGFLGVLMEKSRQGDSLRVAFRGRRRSPLFQVEA
jgi:hypothetical protein